MKIRQIDTGVNFKKRISIFPPKKTMEDLKKLKKRLQLKPLKFNRPVLRNFIQSEEFLDIKFVCFCIDAGQP